MERCQQGALANLGGCLVRATWLPYGRQAVDEGDMRR